MSVRSFYYTWNRQPQQDVFPVERSQHDEFILTDGRRVYDFISTSFQANFGHSHPLIRQRIGAQLERLSIAPPKATFALKQQVSERLNQLFDLGPARIFYTVSGSESTENALKMARQVTGRTKILARQKSYHGASLGALSVTGDWRNRPHFTLDEHTIRIPEPDDDPQLTRTRQIVAAAGPETIAAIILETVSGTNGVAIPTQTWCDAVQALCRDLDLLLIVDEVLCGFGRTGPDFAYQAYGLRPDFVCTSKAITGGYIPLGAVWTGPRIITYYDDEVLSCGLTNYAHPLGLAALDAVLDLMADDDFRHHKAALERVFAEQVTQLADVLSATKRQRGLLAAIELPEGQAAPTWQRCFEHNLHLYSKDNMIILAPPFVSSAERLGEAFDTLHSILCS